MTSQQGIIRVESVLSSRFSSKYGTHFKQIEEPSQIRAGARLQPDQGPVTLIWPVGISVLFE